jgi:hypothetical protein
VEHEQWKLVSRGTELHAAVAAAGRLVRRMAEVFDGSLVVGLEPLDGTFGLPDPDDEHVVAAAVTGGADIIVTDNLRDLPADVLPDGLHVLAARDFAAEIVSSSLSVAARALAMIAGRYTNPPRSPLDLLAILEERYRLDPVSRLLCPLFS